MARIQPTVKTRTLSILAVAAVVIIVLSVMLTPSLGRVLDRPQKIQQRDLERLRDRVVSRDAAMMEYILAHKELDIAIAYIYDEHGVDRLKFDIDLQTGEFVPYREDRAPNVPPTFLKERRVKDNGL